MGRKRSTTSSKAKGVARQQQAAKNRAGAAVQPAAAVDDSWFDGNNRDPDDDWDDITATYPMLRDAVEAARAGESLELPSHDDGFSLRRLLRNHIDEVVFRETIVPDSDVRDLIATVLLNHLGSTNPAESSSPPPASASRKRSRV
ncbi:hypothetical protein PUR61_16985 [Streptomyces sp. BE20]|uniref:hypothetical protein n=1 Tax=Streptomyces sp. BE20 TaxID=3002525 RepID=UPI002E7941D5|nr:hypothetical protein [Streptomyces sp. BE20]MEE1823873.1 hypothetical protein [Streptomyces sp. BE20]